MINLKKAAHIRMEANQMYLTEMKTVIAYSKINITKTYVKK